MEIWNTVSMRRDWFKRLTARESLHSSQRWCRFKKGKDLYTWLQCFMPSGRAKVQAGSGCLCVSQLHLLHWFGCFTSLEFHSYQLTHMSGCWLGPVSQRSSCWGKATNRWGSFYLWQNLIRATSREETLYMWKQNKLGYRALQGFWLYQNTSPVTI